MIRIPIWVLERLIALGKMNPSDVWQQINVEELIRMVKDVM